MYSGSRICTTAPQLPFPACKAHQGLGGVSSVAFLAFGGFFLFSFRETLSLHDSVEIRRWRTQVRVQDIGRTQLCFLQHASPHQRVSTLEHSEANRGNCRALELADGESNHQVPPLYKSRPTWTKPQTLSLLT